MVLSGTSSQLILDSSRHISTLVTRNEHEGRTRANNHHSGALEYDVDPNFPDDPTKDIPRKGSEVAIKKVTNVFSKKILAKRALREIKLLQHFRGHRNITNLETMYITSPRDFNEVYITEGMLSS